MKAQEIDSIQNAGLSSITIEGSIDAYYRYNLDGDYDFAPASSFANLPGFALGMANLIITGESKKVGYVADLVFGPRGEDATFLSSDLRPGGSSNIVNQLHAYWNVMESLKLTMGNFNTFLGYELIAPTDNFNYSMSYLFSYGPFSHTGLKAELTLDNGLSLMAGIMNPTDVTEFNLLNTYAGGFQMGYENGGLGIWLNALLADGFSQFDITAGYDVNENLYLGLNASSASDNFNGIAAYVQYGLTNDFSLGTRIEYFEDTGIGFMAVDGETSSVVNFTFSANYSVEKLTIIPEFRFDGYSDTIVPNGSELNKSLSSFVLAAIYDF